MYRGGGAARSLPPSRPRVRRVVPLPRPRAPGGAFGAARPAAGAKPARAAGVSSNGSKSPPPEPPPLLTAGERGSLAPRTGGSLYPLTSALSRTLRVRRRRAARPAALRSSARTRHAPRPSSRSIVLRRRVNVRLFPGRAAQGHHNPPQSTTIPNSNVRRNCTVSCMKYERSASEVQVNDHAIETTPSSGARLQIRGRT